jgi:hypothetical protein
MSRRVALGCAASFNFKGQKFKGPPLSELASQVRLLSEEDNWNGEEDDWTDDEWGEDEGWGEEEEW